MARNNEAAIGSTVRAGRVSSIPSRYQGRLGQVVGRVKTASGRVKFLVEFPQRSNPLAVSARNITTLG